MPESWREKFDWWAGVAVGTGALLAASPLILSAAGFVSAGVKAGSCAAAIQFSVCGGAIALGSILSGLQSLGATRAAIDSTSTILGSSAVTGVASACPGGVKSAVYYGYAGTSAELRGSCNVTCALAGVVASLFNNWRTMYYWKIGRRTIDGIKNPTIESKYWLNVLPNF